ncbi:MAG: glycosyltransferase [Anaerolineae bacterium]|nr:glycosyltransferase [Anaerolineae bacterium]
MRILQASSSDTGGGAERIAWLLFEAYRQRGHESALAVGKKHSDDPDVLLIPNETTRDSALWTGFWRRQHRKMQPVQGRGAWRVGRVFYDLAEPIRTVRRQLGHEDFAFPATRQLLNLQPQIFHAHNLHNGYFDLRLLPEISRSATTILTLHDEWLLTGHCAYAIDCPLWETGCGHCPDLSLYPAIKRDATAYNWRRKAEIYRKSRLYVATPSQWLMDRVKRSMLNPVETRVIPHGVDGSVFRPADKNAAKKCWI